MNANDTAKCYLIGIYKLPESDTKVIIALVQNTLGGHVSLITWISLGWGKAPSLSNYMYVYYIEP